MCTLYGYATLGRPGAQGSGGGGAKASCMAAGGRARTRRGLRVVALTPKNISAYKEPSHPPSLALPRGADSDQADGRAADFCAATRASARARRATQKQLGVLAGLDPPWPRHLSTSTNGRITNPSLDRQAIGEDPRHPGGLPVHRRRVTRQVAAAMG